MKNIIKKGSVNFIISSVFKEDGETLEKIISKIIIKKNYETEKLDNKKLNK